MLLGNYSVFNKMPLRFRAGRNVTAEAFATAPSNYQRPGWSCMAWQDGDSAARPEIGFPSGYYDRGWKLPLGLSSSSIKIQYLSGISAKMTLTAISTCAILFPGYIVGSSEIIFSSESSPIALSWISGTTAEAGLTVPGIVNAVWGATAADYVVTGSMGKKLNDAGGSTSPTDIANAVWEKPKSELTGAGTVGKEVVDISKKVDDAQVLSLL